MKKKTIHTGGQKTPGLPFQGEMMVCEMCARQQKSDPKVESNWTAIEIPDTGKVIYLCPICFKIALS